jgi:hypothetical protein
MTCTNSMITGLRLLLNILIRLERDNVAVLEVEKFAINIDSKEDTCQAAEETKPVGGHEAKRITGFPAKPTTNSDR